MSQLDPTIASKVHGWNSGNSFVVDSGGFLHLQPGAKLGPYGSTQTIPIASASQAAASQTQTAVTDNSGGTVSTTLAAVTAGVAYAQADAVALKNAVASLNAELALAKADIAVLIALSNAMRTALLNLGLIKGSA